MGPVPGGARRVHRHAVGPAAQRVCCSRVGALLPLLPLLLLASGARAAAVDLQVFGGGRSAAVATPVEHQQRFDGVEGGLAVLAQPWAERMVSFGVFAAEQQLDAAPTPETKERLSGLQAGIETYAWWPAGLIQPFVRFGAALVGTQTYRATVPVPGYGITGTGTLTKRIEESGALRGYHGAAGLQLTPLRGYGAFLELDVARESFTPAAGGARMWMTSHAFLLGASQSL